jgi:hypothetical protein
MKPLTLADVPSYVIEEHREHWLAAERHRLRAEENLALAAQIRPVTNTLIPGNERAAEGGRHTARCRADIAENRAEEARQERLKWERRVDELAAELADSYWYEHSDHKTLLDEIFAARHRYGDEELMRDLRKRVDTAWEKWHCGRWGWEQR